MNIDILIAFVIVAMCSLLIGFCIGALVESKSLLNWFYEELDVIEERYKRKYDKDGDSHDEP